MSDSAKDKISSKQYANSGKMKQFATYLGSVLQNFSRGLPIALFGNLPGKTVVLGVLAAIVIVIAGSILLAWVTARMDYSSINDPNSASMEPVSITPGLEPQRPDGVTIIAKQPEAAPVSTQALAAPTLQGSAAASGFAMDMGAALSYAELSARFARISRMNGQDIFRRLEPRAVLRDTVTGLEARLLVGPFDNLDDARTACKAIKTVNDMSCLATKFEGELIARE